MSLSDTLHQEGKFLLTAMVMAVKHNKKQNVGLLYEFIMAEMSERLVKDDSAGARRLLKLVRRRFAPGTALHTELAAYKSLLQGGLTSEHLAAAIIDETLMVTAKTNRKAVMRELVELNRDLGRFVSESFYDRQVQDYKSYASVWTLIAETTGSKSTSPLLARTAQHRNVVMERLLTPHASQNAGMNVASSHLETPEETRSSRLVIGLMLNKLKEAYGDKLSTEQRAILREHVLSVAGDGSTERLTNMLRETKLKVVTTIDSFLLEHGDDDRLGDEAISELKHARGSVIDESLDVIDDAVVCRFMSYLELAKECSSHER